MAQSLPRSCPRCGTETIASQKFCPKCGWNMSTESSARPSTQSPEQSQRPPSGQPLAERSSRFSSNPISNAGIGPSSNPPSNPGIGSAPNPISNAGIGSTPNPISNAGIGPTPNPPSSPGLGPASNPPSRPVPKRPSMHAAPPSLEPLSRSPSRPSLEPLSDRAISSSQEQYLDQETLTPGIQPSTQAISSGTGQSSYSPIPQVAQSSQYQDEKQWHEQMGVPAEVEPVALPSPEGDDVESLPTQMLSQGQGQAQAYAQTPVQAPIQDQPQWQGQDQAQAYTQSAAQSQPQGQDQAQAYTQNQPQPEPQFPSASPRRRLRTGRIAILLIVLLVILGGAGFGIVWFLQQSRTASQPTITTTTLGTAVNYAGVDIAVVNAKKSQSFLDDPNSTSDGMLRVQLRAQNKTSVAINLPYETITHITLPGGKVVSPVYVKSNEHLTPNATQAGFMDFAVPENVRVNQVIFHLGNTNEAQIDIPLMSHANVDQYATKVVHPNQQMSFYNLNWSLTSVSVQFHIDGQQVSKDMRYLVLTLSVSNPLTETAIPGSPYDYVQLQANTTAIPLADTTLPISFEAGVNGKTGTLTFLVPEADTSFTLTLVNAADGFDGANTNNTATFHV